MKHEYSLIVLALLLAACVFIVPVTAEGWDTPSLNDSDLQDMGVVNGAPTGPECETYLNLAGTSLRLR